MKTLHSFIIRKGLIAGGIIALIIMLCAGEPAFAARVAGTDENVNTTTAPADTAKKIIKVSPAVSDTSIKQAIPPADQAKQVKTEKVMQTSEEIQDEKLPAHPAKKEAAKKYVTLDFDNVEIGVLVKFVSELTGKNFIIDDKVKGKVTIISPKKIPIGDVYKVFLSVLEINGFTVVPSGNMIKIIPSVSAREKGLETRTKKDPAAQEDRMVTQIVTLERANPDEIKRVLDPIISKSSSVLSYPPAGILVITDYLSNIKRLQEIILALDVEGAGDQISYIPMQHASASEVVKSLTTIFQQNQGKANAIKAVVDSRTNSIIILASGADTENVRKLVAFMDKDIPRGESNIKVYRLQNSIAEDLAKVLNNIVKDSGAAAATGGTAAATGGAAAATGGAAAAQKALAPVVLKNVQVVPDKATNTLVVMAEREDYKILENIIKQLDVPRPMVYIEALIMEVNTNKDFTLGVQWQGVKETGSVDGNSVASFIGSNTGIMPSPTYDSTSGLTSLALPSGFSMGIMSGGITIGGVTLPNIAAIVQAYKTDSDVSILSTPQIMTLNNEEAEINVGSNVPYITQQQQSTTSTLVGYNTYEYKDVGVILNITPNINEENFIRLKISQQVTKLTSSAASTTPTTLKRTAKTTVVVKDNETVVIAGLVGDSTEDSTTKVPLLGDIPLLGWLFKAKTVTREKTNLYVFLTPHIVRTQKDAAGLYQEKRETMGEVVEGIIKLDEKKSETKPHSAPIPAGGTTPANP